MAAVLLAIGTSAAVAEDGVPSWSGFYGGAHIGYGWGERNGEIAGEFEKIFDVVPDLGVNPGQRARDGEVEEEYTSRLEGILGGFHVGGNLQLNSFVFGFEGDYDWSGVDTSKSFDPEIGLNAATAAAIANGTARIEGDPKINYSAGLDDVASIRGRVGFATEKYLIYATAGWAAAEAKISVSSQAAPGFPSGSFSTSDTLDGYVIGGGVEYRLSRYISLRAEALHYDLGSLKYEFESEDAATNNIEELEGKQDFAFTQVRAGLSLHLN